MHWLIVHMHQILSYGYEVFGGILIFWSSAVTETSRPSKEKMKHWIIFGVLAIAFIVIGVALRSDEVRQFNDDRAETIRARQDVRDMRSTLDNRMSTVLSSFQTTYAQLGSLSSDLSTMRNNLMQTIYKNDPRQMHSLEQQAQTEQARVDSLSHELLAMTMAPQIADQLRGWEGERSFEIDMKHNQEWEEEMRFGRDAEHQDLSGAERTKGVKEIEQRWRSEYLRSEQEYLDKLKGTISTADFVRKELMKRITGTANAGQAVLDKREEQQFTQALNNPLVLDRMDAANYLESLAKRVPPPK